MVLVRFVVQRKNRQIGHLAEIVAIVSPMVAFATPNGGTLAKAALSLHRPEEWPEVLSVSQVADLLAIGRGAVVAAIERGQLSAVAIGGQYRIAAESVWRLVPSEIRANWPEGRWRTVDPPEE
jgi:excisionase family DNA binding protein